MINWKKLVTVTVLFTTLDYILHYLHLLPDVEIAYFFNKLIITPILLIVLIDKLKLKESYALWLTVILLQTRYYFMYGWDMQTNVLMILAHYGVLWMSLKVYQKYGGTYA